MKRLFGTDGVRGKPGQYPLDWKTVAALGAALVELLHHRGWPERILLAGDTRESTPLLASWFAGAFVGAGGEVVWAGVLPTPAVSHLLREKPAFGAGVVVSASHNPAADNGIKVLAPTGEKLSLEDEDWLEKKLPSTTPRGAPFLPSEDGSFRGAYLAFLERTLPSRVLFGLKLVVDAANGAASFVAKPFLEAVGAEVTLLHASPDGRNINLACGALHPESLAAAVRETAADAGVALDGDGDRAVLVTHTGRVLNGDDLLLLWARRLKRQQLLPGGTVVATVMSNLALDVALRREDMRLVRCPVGDREVWEAMGREGAALGGEQSGHIICAHHSVTGDGLLTAAQVLAFVARDGTNLEAQADLVPFPQVLLGVPVREKRPLEEVPALADAIRDAEAGLGGTGRLVVRYSGTEKLLRIMVEARDPGEAHKLARKLAQIAKRELG
ncbi:MAG: phosphoglucosamine mutase [Thermoanaerobaculum sp.]